MLRLEKERGETLNKFGNPRTEENVGMPRTEARLESFLMPRRRVSEVSKLRIQATQVNLTNPASSQSNLGKSRMISPGPESGVEVVKVPLTWRPNTESSES